METYSLGHLDELLVPASCFGAVLNIFHEGGREDIKTGEYGLRYQVMLVCRDV
jgi:hypothetical protein